MQRKYLVVARCGDTSLHPTWLARETSDRNWDLHLSYFGPNPQRYIDADRGESISFEKGPKYLGLHEFVQTHLDLLRNYAYVAFPDDDLQFTEGCWSDVLSQIDKTGAGLAQPSLDRRSFWMHDLLLRRKRFAYRQVDFIEVMTPVFRTDFLLDIYERFTLNKSSWGLDFVWSTAAAERKLPLFVIDTCSLLHTRRVGKGGQYGGAALTGLFNELDQTLADLNIKTWYGRTLAAWTATGPAKEPLALINRQEYLPRFYNFVRNKMQLNTIGT